jgi:hypothetical protein
VPTRTPSAARPPLKLAGLLGIGLCMSPAHAGPADWLPAPSANREYTWTYEPCNACTELSARPGWRTMAALAGVPGVRFQAASDGEYRPAYSVAPNVVVVSPSGLKSDRCELRKAHDTGLSQAGL